MANFRSLVGGYYSDKPFAPNVNVSIRTNNPGALNVAPWVRAYPGYVGDKVTSDTTAIGGGANSTVIFETPEQGVAAWWELLRKYNASGASTVSAIINRYGGGQDYSDYVKTVAGWSGLSEGTPIDLRDDATLLKFAKAMFRYEAGQSTPLSDKQIVYGFKLGRQYQYGAPPATKSWLSSLIDLIFGHKAAPTTVAPSTPWMAEAQKWLGFHETGINHGIDTLIALAKCGSDGDPWCAIFVNAMLETRGIRGTRSPAARSFETDSNFVRLSGPAYGAITTMFRGAPSSGLGHVFFYVGENDKGVLALGGNQSDQVCRQYEPRDRIVGHFWPKSQPLPKVGAITVKDEGANAGSET